MNAFSITYQNDNHNRQICICLIHTPKSIISLPLDNILFIESREKHSIIHTKTKSIPLSIPLYRILQSLPEGSFLQTHRSFIVNLKKISYIDKSGDPWLIFFHNTQKNAYISRSYRKDFLKMITGLSSH